jgi:hypothetical protein
MEKSLSWLVLKEPIPENIQVERPWPSNPNSKLVQNLKKNWASTSCHRWKFHTSPHVNCHNQSRCTKILCKITSACSYKVYMKHKWILCLDLYPKPKIIHYAYANIPKAEKNLKWKTLRSLAFQIRATPPESHAFKGHVLH